MLYEMKGIPTLYYYKDGGYVGKEDRLKNFEYTYDRYDIRGKHRIVAESILIDQYLLEFLQGAADLTIYTWTYGYGKDEERGLLCYKYSNVNLENFNYYTDCLDKSATFEYVFSATKRELVSVDEIPEAMRSEIKLPL